MLPHRRHRKASPEPTPPGSPVPHADRNSHAAGGGGGGGGGLYSYFATARRRFGRNHRETDTLLPTTYSASSGKSLKRGTGFNPATKSCNEFLMGGHYYPGKDKKRRTMRKRTLWYRIFCASTWRKLCSFLMVAYVIVYHVLVPLGGWLLDVGKSLSARGGHSVVKTNWLQYDSTLMVPSLHEEQMDRERITSERARLQYGSNGRDKLRLNLLEELVPRWFHRNDLSAEHHPGQVDGEGVVAHEDSHPHPKNNDNQKATGHKKRKSFRRSRAGNATSTHAVNTTTQEEASNRKQLGIPEIRFNATQRMIQVKGHDFTVARNLHNMDKFASTSSSCPSIKSSDWKTSLVIQTSLNRLWILNETCARWKDPIIAVVFVKEDEQPPPLQIACPNVKIIQYMATNEESELKNYPVNRLRNVGLDAVTTSHVLVVDIDFIPSQDLHLTIAEALKHRHGVLPEGEDDQQALIVPAFERKPPEPCGTESLCAKYLQSNSSFIPHSFHGLQECVLQKSCIVFQSEINWEGHYSTRSEEWLQKKWYQDEEEDLFRTLPCFHTARYEPYVVLRWCPVSTSDDDHDEKETKHKPVAPYYDERFHGYGKNKIELVSHLRKSGYKFAILPEGFIVHNPHPESDIKETWNDRRNSDLHASMDQLYTIFLNELDSKYRDIHNTTVKLCKHQ
jgi:hypothetical protein